MSPPEMREQFSNREYLRLAVLLPTARLNTEMLSNKSFSLTLSKLCLFNLGSLTPSEITRTTFRRSEPAFSNRLAAEYTPSSKSLLAPDPQSTCPPNPL